MQPDPSLLRSAATVLVLLAGDLRERGAAVRSTAAALRWAAPVVDAVRRQLADADAAALTGCGALEAGAAHLRRLATAVEELEAAARRLHQQALADGRDALAGAPPGPEHDELRRALDRVPPPDDPSWAAAAGVPPVPLPEPARVPAAAVAPGPPGVVVGEPEAVRGLGRAASAAAEAAHAVRVGCAARTAALGLARLDAHGLAGSRSAQWLAEITSPASPLAAAMSGWADGGHRALLFADLLAAADDRAALAGDPRVALALEVLAVLRRSPADAAARLAELPPADVAWLLRVVPGLRPAAQPPPASVLAPPGPVDVADWLNGVAQAPHEVARGLQQEVSELVAQARALRRAARTADPATRGALRAASDDALRRARQLRDQAAAASRLAARLPVPAWLRRWSTTPLVDGPWVRGVSRLGAAGAVLSAFLDIRSGTSAPLALAAAAVGVAAGAAATAGAVAAALALGAPVVVVVGGGLIAGAVVGWLGGGLVKRFGPPVWSAVDRAGRALARQGRQVSTSVRRRLSDTAARGMRAGTDQLRRVADAVGRWRDGLRLPQRRKARA